MAEAALNRPQSRWFPQNLPNEHGFWVMLAAALGSALLRARLSFASAGVALGCALLAIAAGSAGHRSVRSSSRMQLAATVGLAFAGAPVELSGGLSAASVAVRSLARAVVFFTSALVVRAAFARSARRGEARSRRIAVASVVVPSLAGLAFLVAQRLPEAAACLMTSGLCAVLVHLRPTAKQLKPLGLALAGLALLSAVALAL
jgi:hypothetical protein